MVRRLKTDIKNPDGSPRFPGRQIRAIEVGYTDAERQAYELLQSYAAARRARPSALQSRAGDLVTLILKKRLFSSPAAFALTLESHFASEDQGHSMAQRNRGSSSPSAAAFMDDDGDEYDWLMEQFDWDDEPADDDPGSDDERVLFDRVADFAMVTDGSVMEAAYRKQLREWADRHAAPADSKAKALVAEVDRVCRPGGDWAAGERATQATGPAPSSPHAGQGPAGDPAAARRQSVRQAA